MEITICNKKFNTESIKGLSITENAVLIDAVDDFYRLRYTNENEILDAKTYLKFEKLKKEELMDAVRIIIITCDYFINSKTQCESCPLKRSQGCVFNSNPIEWRY